MIGKNFNGRSAREGYLSLVAFSPMIMCICEATNTWYSICFLLISRTLLRQFCLVDPVPNAVCLFCSSFTTLLALLFLYLMGLF